MQNINLEETKLITDDLNKIIIPMGNPHINNRKNSLQQNFNKSFLQDHLL